MAFDALTAAEIAVGKPVKQPLMEKIKDNFDYLYGAIGASAAIGILNPSFEVDADSDGVPDNWTKSLYSGGSGAYETTNAVHGAKAYKFVHPGGGGNGGGYLTSDYIEMHNTVDLTDIIISFFLKTSAAGMKVKCEILNYDKDKIALAGGDASVTVYESTPNIVDWVRVAGHAALPAGTRYIKVRLHGGVDDTDVAGTVYFDFVMLDAYQYEPTQAGTTLISSADTPQSTAATTYTKLKEIKINHAGELRIKFDLKTSGAGTPAYGRIYRNGVAIGTERSTTDTVYTTYSEDISGWLPGDLLQLYAHGTGGVTATVDDLRLYRGDQERYAAPDVITD